MQFNILKSGAKQTWWRIGIGFGVVMFGLLVPKFVQVQQFGLLNDLYDSINFEDSGLLLIASAKLVLLNSIRHVPVYVGTFVMAEGFYTLFRSHQLGFIVSLVTIPAAYKCISVLYNMSFVFGGPSYLTLLTILILHWLTTQIKPLFIKVIIISLFLFGLDWLDIVPMLSVYGFGRGEIAVSIKQVTEFLEAEYTMNFVGLTFTITIIVSALILSKVVIEYYKRLFLMEESKQQEERLRRIEVEALEWRYFKEIKHLVHDLKTPLVTIQGLSGVLKMKLQDAKSQEYTERICSSAERMSLMISEILYEDTMRVLTVEELFHFIRIQIVSEGPEALVEFDLMPDLRIYANKIRMSRALINLIENGLTAVRENGGRVKVSVGRDGSGVLIKICDTGNGIALEHLQSIWQLGYTTGTGHSGLGLNFARQVIEDHGGRIAIESQLGEGTEVSITLAEVDTDYEQNTCS